MVTERTRAINALTALLRTIDLGVDTRKALPHRQFKVIAGWRDRREDSVVRTCRHEAIRLAKRIVALDAELVDNRKALDAAVEDVAPELCELPGVGSVIAACVLTAWSHPGRVRSEAAFAALAGTCPIPASSGNTLRHRLNRGGDRRLNRALTTVVIVRMRTHAPTRPTSPGAEQKVAPPRRSCAHASATSLDNSSGPSPQHIRFPQLLDVI